MDMKGFRRPCVSKTCSLYAVVTVVIFITVNGLYSLTQSCVDFHWLEEPKADFHWLGEPLDHTSFHLTNETIWFSNEATGERFKVRISLRSKEQFELANKLSATENADLFIPIKRIWTNLDRYTNEWIRLDLMSKVSGVLRDQMTKILRTRGSRVGDPLLPLVHMGVPFGKGDPVLLNSTKSPCWYDVHNTLFCLPYMYLIGAPKCGTTDLYERLLQHPDFIEPSQKEPHWISRKRLDYSALGENTERNTQQKKPPVANYLSYFTKLKLKLTRDRQINEDNITVNPLITGDCSASTLWDNDIWTMLPHNNAPLEPMFTNPHYVYKLNPKAKIIVLLRDPVARLYSDYLYFLPETNNKSKALFHNQVIDSIRLFTSCLKSYSLRSCVYNPQLNNFVPLRLRIGIYYVYLREWFAVFPSNQILVLQTERYAKFPTQTVQQVYKFLGLDPLNEEYLSSITRARKKNIRKASDESIGDMWPETRLLLKSFYKTFNELLETFLNSLPNNDMQPSDPT